MKVLDLFCGLKGWSKAFQERGHEVVTVDILEKFNPTLLSDIMTLQAWDLEGFGKFDVVLASPPCNCFSCITIGKYWKEGKPSNKKTEDAIALVFHTLMLIEGLKPSFWIMENPMGMLRKIIKPRARISYCKYGEKRMKPTDLWGDWPDSFITRDCNYGNPDHYRTSRKNFGRGFMGTMAMKNSEERAKIPYQLSLEFCLACEKALDK